MEVEVEKAAQSGARAPFVESYPRFEVLMSEVGGPKPGLMNIGSEAKPRYANLHPASLLLTRAKQFAALAPMGGSA